MSKRKIRSKQSVKILEKKSKLKINEPIRERIRVIIMALKGHTDREIAELLGRSLGWVKKWVARFSAGGLENLFDKLRSGKPPRLQPAQKDELREAILKGPAEGEALARFRVLDVVDLAEKKFGTAYSISGMRGMMKEMGLSHVKSRPIHPKKDKKAANGWKKKPKNS